MAGVVIDKVYTGKEVMEIILAYKNSNKDIDPTNRMGLTEYRHTLCDKIAELFNDMHYFKKGEPCQIRRHNMAGGAWLDREYYDFCDKTKQYIVIYHPANGEPRLEFCEEIRVPRQIM